MGEKHTSSFSPEFGGFVLKQHCFNNEIYVLVLKLTFNENVFFSVKVYCFNKIHDYRAFPNKYPPLKDPKSEEFGLQYLLGRFEPPQNSQYLLGNASNCSFSKGTFEIPKFSRCARPNLPSIYLGNCRDF